METEQPTGAIPLSKSTDPVSPSQGLLPLSASVVKVWTIKSSLGVAAFSLGVLVFEVAQLVGGDNFLPFGSLTGSVVVAGGLLAFFIPRLRYRFWRYKLHDEELFVQRGLLNRVQTIVPLRRIQHLDVSQDIVEREFDLGKLIVHTAGSRSSDVVLPGLDIAEANRLRDQMKNYILEDAV